MHDLRLYERRCTGMHGMRHAPNASIACTGGYSCWQGGCSRITPTTTRAEQPATSIGRAWQHLPRARTSTMHGLSGYERDDAGMHGMRHALNASNACTGGYSWWHGGCSRTIPTTTRAEQPATSIGRAWQHLPCARSTMHDLYGYERRGKHAWNAPRARRVHRVHGRLQLLVGRL